MTATGTKGRRWSQPVTETTNAFRSAMSMLTFYINRAGKALPKEQKQRLEAAKNELRALYHHPRK